MVNSKNIIRHFLATLEYRLQTSIKDAPLGFGNFDAGNGVRTPSEIIRHMARVLMYARRNFENTAEVNPRVPLISKKRLLVSMKCFKF